MQSLQEGDERFAVRIGESIERVCVRLRLAAVLRDGRAQAQGSPVVQIGRGIGDAPESSRREESVAGLLRQGKEPSGLGLLSTRSVHALADQLRHPS